LALQQYIKDNPEQSYDSPNAVLDPVFRQYATYQVRLFLLAGNDTTSTTLMFIFHMLHKNPKCLQLMREEHHRVFGTVDDEDTAGQIRRDPALLNKMRYTDAVVKETMRIYPAGGASRDGLPGSTITDEEGEVIPLDRCLVSTNQVALHNNPRFWPRPNEFLPERWLVEPGHELYPGNTAAWRPFEHGPRNCIGQTLVWAELRTVLALTARTFTVTPAYEEWDAKREWEEGMLTRLLKSMGFANPVRTYKGERAYMTDSAASRPSEGYPCRVELTSPH
jgi:cytochrome P450